MSDTTDDYEAEQRRIFSETRAKVCRRARARDRTFPSPYLGRGTNRHLPSKRPKDRVKRKFRPRNERYKLALQRLKLRYRTDHNIG